MEGAAEGGDVSTISDSFLSGGAGQFVVEEVQEENVYICRKAIICEGAEDQETGEEGVEAVAGEPLREQDRFLPIANVARIMKKSIPSTGKIAKDAKECVQECVSEFISFITSEASERCHQEKRKTINGEDILFAMSTLGFDNYVEPLKVFLQKYRESTKGDKTQAEEMAEMSAADDAFTSALASNILTTDTGQQNVIYTAAYPGSQISQQQLTFT